MKKTWLIATVAAALFSFAGLAQARAPMAMDRDGGHSGEMHPSRYVNAPRYHGPNIFRPLIGHRRYRRRWREHGHWHYSY